MILVYCTKCYDVWECWQLAALQRPGAICCPQECTLEVDHVWPAPYAACYEVPPEVADAVEAAHRVGGRNAVRALMRKELA